MLVRKPPAPWYIFSSSSWCRQGSAKQRTPWLSCVCCDISLLKSTQELVCHTSFYNMMLEIYKLLLPAIVIQILQSIKELVRDTFDNKKIVSQNQRWKYQDISLLAILVLPRLDNMSSKFDCIIYKLYIFLYMCFLISPYVRLRVPAYLGTRGPIKHCFFC